MASKIKNVVETTFTSKGAAKVEKDTNTIGRAQTRLGQESASAGRQFAAQASGLGGIVAAYAGAAATIFALGSAFEALARSARAAQTIDSLNVLAAETGASGKELAASVQDVLKGQLTLLQTTEKLNISLSAGFNTEQIEGLAEVALRSSRALGRDLNDSFSRVVKGAAELNTGVLKQLGVFVRVDTAVAAYATALGKSASELTEFERRQALVNAVIDEGNRKFSGINTTIPTTLQKIDSFTVKVRDLAVQFGIFLADSLAPLASILTDSVGGAFAALGIAISLIASKGVAVLTAGTAALTSSITNTGIATENYIRSLTKTGAAATAATAAIAGLDSATVKLNKTQSEELSKLQDAAASRTLSSKEIKTGISLVNASTKALQAERQALITSTAADRERFRGLQARLRAFEDEEARARAIDVRGLTVRTGAKDPEFIARTQRIAEAKRQQKELRTEIEQIRPTIQANTLLIRENSAALQLQRNTLQSLTPALQGFASGFSAFAVSVTSGTAAIISGFTGVATSLLSIGSRIFFAVNLITLIGTSIAGALGRAREFDALISNIGKVFTSFFSSQTSRNVREVLQGISAISLEGLEKVDDTLKDIEEFTFKTKFIGFSVEVTKTKQDLINEVNDLLVDASVGIERSLGEQAISGVIGGGLARGLFKGLVAAAPRLSGVLGPVGLAVGTAVGIGAGLAFDKFFLERDFEIPAELAKKIRSEFAGALQGADAEVQRRVVQTIAQLRERLGDAARLDPAARAALTFQEQLVLASIKYLENIEAIADIVSATAQPVDTIVRNFTFERVKNDADDILTALTTIQGLDFRFEFITDAQRAALLEAIEASKTILPVDQNISISYRELLPVLTQVSEQGETLSETVARVSQQAKDIRFAGLELTSGQIESLNASFDLLQELLGNNEEAAKELAERLTEAFKSVDIQKPFLDLLNAVNQYQQSAIRAVEVGRALSDGLAAGAVDIEAFTQGFSNLNTSIILSERRLNAAETALATLNAEISRILEDGPLSVELSEQLSALREQASVQQGIIQNVTSQLIQARELRDILEEQGKQLKIQERITKFLAGFEFKGFDPIKIAFELPLAGLTEAEKFLGTIQLLLQTINVATEDQRNTFAKFSEDLKSLRLIDPEVQRIISGLLGLLSVETAVREQEEVRLRDEVTKIRVAPISEGLTKVAPIAEGLTRVAALAGDANEAIRAAFADPIPLKDIESLIPAQASEKLTTALQFLDFVAEPKETLSDIIKRFTDTKELQRAIETDISDIESNFSDIESTILDGLRELTVIIGSGADDLQNTIDNIPRKLTTGITGLAESTNTIFNEVVTVARDANKSLEEVFREAIAARDIGEDFSKIIFDNQSTKPFQVSLQFLTDKARPEETLSGILERFADTDELQAAIRDGFVDIRSEILDNLKQLAVVIGPGADALRNAIDSIPKTFSTRIQGIAESTETAFNRVADSVRAVATEVDDSVKQVLTSLDPSIFATRISDSTETVFSRVANSVKAVITGVGDSVKQVLTSLDPRKLAGSVRDIFTSIADSIESTESRLKKVALGTPLTRLKDAVADLNGELVEARRRLENLSIVIDTQEELQAVRDQVQKEIAALEEALPTRLTDFLADAIIEELSKIEGAVTTFSEEGLEQLITSLKDIEGLTVSAAEGIITFSNEVGSATVEINKLADAVTGALSEKAQEALKNFVLQNIQRLPELVDKAVNNIKKLLEDIGKELNKLELQERDIIFKARFDEKDFNNQLAVLQSRFELDRLRLEVDLVAARVSVGDISKRRGVIEENRLQQDILAERRRLIDLELEQQRDIIERKVEQASIDYQRALDVIEAEADAQRLRVEQERDFILNILDAYDKVFLTQDEINKALLEGIRESGQALADVLIASFNEGARALNSAIVSGFNRDPEFTVATGQTITPAVNQEAAFNTALAEARQKATESTNVIIRQIERLEDRRKELALQTSTAVITAAERELQIAEQTAANKIELFEIESQIEALKARERLQNIGGKLSEEAERLKQIYLSVFDGIRSSIETSLIGVKNFILYGEGNLRDVFVNLLRSIADAILEEGFIKPISESITRVLFGALTGIEGGKPGIEKAFKPTGAPGNPIHVTSTTIPLLGGLPGADETGGIFQNITSSLTSLFGGLFGEGGTIVTILRGFGDIVGNVFSGIFKFISSIFGFTSGGSVVQRAAGGAISQRPGSKQRDRVPALLEPGEFVLRRRAVKELGLPVVQQLNATGQTSVMAAENDIVVQRAAGGAIFQRPGSKQRDRVPALLEPGEFVLGRSAVKELGLSTVQQLNATGQVPRNIIEDTFTKRAVNELELPQLFTTDQVNTTGVIPQFTSGDSVTKRASRTTSTQRAARSAMPKFASGGMQRDRVPAMIEPGEFVLRKRSVKELGLPVVQQLNSTGKTPTSAPVVNIINEGTAKTAEVEQPRFDGERYVIDIITRDLQNNGPIRRTLRSGI